MATIESTFAQLENALQQGGTKEVLEQLADQLLQDGKYHELFEARKMEVRHRLGLPLLYSDSGDDLTDEDGFAAVQQSGGIAVLVGPPGQPTRAEYRLDSPQEVAETLRLLLQL